MRKTLLLTCISLFATTAALAGAAFKMMGAGELATLLKQKGATVAVYDANNEETRQKEGIIPGAHLLTSSSKFDPQKELTPNKNTKLVFYCANTKCTASHKAAELAIAAGYKDVAVMSDGIQGWAKSGHEVSRVNAPAAPSGH